MLLLQDLTDEARETLVDEDIAGTVICQWMASDRPSKNTRRLLSALARRDWPAVHAAADYLMMKVEVV